MSKGKLFATIVVIITLSSVAVYSYSTISTEMPDEDEIIATTPKTEPIPAFIILIAFGIIMFIISRSLPCPWRKIK